MNLTIRKKERKKDDETEERGPNFQFEKIMNLIIKKKERKKKERKKEDEREERRPNFQFEKNNEVA